MNVPKAYWKTCWTFITPILIIFVTIMNYANYTPNQFLNYEFPPLAQLLGWIIELLPVFIVIGFAIVAIVKRARAGESVAFLQSGPLMTPKDKWGPRHDSGLANPAYEEEAT